MRAVLALGAFLALVAGCGGATVGAITSTTSPPPPRTAAPPQLVVLDWSAAINHDLNAEAAAYFAPGARVVSADGRSAVLHDRDEAELFSASIVCQGRVVAMSRDGDRVTAMFVLDNRGTFICPDPLSSDSATFTVRQGKIVLFEILPD